MKRRLVARMAGSVALAAGTIVAMTMPATAVDPQPVPADGAAAQLEAMQRDLGLTPQQAQQRLAQEAAAINADQAIRADLAGGFGGSYFDAARGTLVVGVLEPSQASKVSQAGAEPRPVAHSERDLNEAADKLNARADHAPKQVSGWYVDTVSNSVVLTTARGSAGQASEFVRSAGAEDAVRVTESDEAPRTLIDVMGGNAYYINNAARCSVGFSVQGGFVSAGHCGSPGDTTTQPTGTFAASSFPGNDYSYVQVAAGNTLRPWVNMYNGYARVVSGSTEAPVGASVCRSGSTTGWHCGSVQAKNQTVNYAQGTVYGLTRTNVCAEPGDSGGSFISGNQAQGMTSGGSGNCTSGGTTYFQPVNEVLSAYHLSLITG